MKHWTDDDLGALLTESMRAKERLVDEGKAQRVGRLARPVRRRWPVELAAAAAVVVVVCAGLYVALRSPNTVVAGGGARFPGLESSPVTPGPTSGADANYRLAAAASEATLADFVPPPGSTQIAGKPAGWVRDGSGKAPADPSLSRTSWWRTSMSYVKAKAYLAKNPPQGMVTNGSASGADHGKETTFSQIYQALKADNPAAYTVPVLFVRVQSLKGRTYLEAVSFIDSYSPVPEAIRIGERVTSVRITGVSRNTSDRGSSTPAEPPLTLTQPQDAALISQLVHTYNALPGSPPGNGLHPCPAPLPSPVVVTFTGESGRVWVVTLGTDCNDKLQVSVDGRPAGLALTPLGWLSELQDVVKKSSGTS